MSLINDALKRASQSIKQRGPVSPEGPAMQPVQSATPSRFAAKLVLPIGLGLVLVFGLAGWFLWKSLQVGGLDPSAAGPTKVSTPRLAAVPAPVPVAAPRVPPNLATNIATNQSPAAPPVTPPIARPVVPATPTQAVAAPLVTAPMTKPPASTAAAPATVTAPSPPPTFPELKLQAIYFRRVNPSATINGRNVSVGAVVEGVKVTAIERQHVTVELEGHKKDLFME